MNLKNIYKNTAETLREGFADRSRLGMSLGVDGYGASSTLGYLFGGAPGLALDSLDIVTSVGQTAYILKSYGDELTQRERAVISTISMLEELLPGFTDLIPTATITHFYVANKRTRKESVLESREDILWKEYMNANFPLI